MKDLHATHYAIFRDILKKERQAQGLKQREIATRLNMPQSFVSKYENGERRLDVVEFLAVSKALGADPMKILKLLNRLINQTNGAQ